jgi:hypothetical protein
MALSDLAVFQEYAYTGMQEALDYNVDLFNSATGGCIVLRTRSHLGDFSDEAFWRRLDGLVRRRNAYGTATLSEINLAMAVDTMVKIAAGTPPVAMDPAQFKWIQQNPEEGGALYGRQLAVDMVADMVNTGVMAFIAATIAEAEVFVDVSGVALDYTHFNTGQAAFGDRAGAIRLWVMHSAPMFNLWGTNIANANRLFVFGNVSVRNDPFGRPIVITDAPSLVEPGTPDTYYTLGLTGQAIVVDQNADFTTNTSTTNGKENIHRTIQSEWSYNLGLKGYAWDKTNGGKSPNDAALAVSTNWDKIVTSHKDLGGVIIQSRAA